MSTTAEPLSSQRDLDPAKQQQSSPAHDAQGSDLFGLSTSTPPDRTFSSMSSPVMRSPAAASLRSITMRSAQQRFGNGFSQRVMAQLQRKPVQRSCECGGTCASCRQHEEESRLVQRNAAGPATMVAAIPNTAGAPLDESTRGFMEARLGHDFRDVRVHTDGGSADAAQQMQANAFTTGREIYFSEGKYQPQTQEGRHLIAHELTHVAQQESGSAPQNTISMDPSGIEVGHPDDPLEHEAEESADRAMAGGARQEATADPSKKIRRGIAGDIWDATGGRVVNYVGDKVEEAWDSIKEWVIEKLEKYAPGLLALLRGGVVGYLAEKIFSGLDSLFGGVLSQIREKGFLGAASSLISQFTGPLEKAFSGMVAGACESFAAVAGAVTSIAKAIGGTLFETIKTIGGWVGNFFSGLWEHLLQPAWNAIKSVAGAVWDWIVDKAKWIWDKTEPVREWFGRAWNWLKKQFGLAWSSGSGVLDWFKEKAKAAWDKVYAFTKPIHGALQAVGIGLLIVSGLGPIIVIWKGAPVLWDALTWLYNAWKKTDFIVTARKALTEHILPAISNGAQKAADAIESAVNWLTEKVDAVDKGLGGLLDALGASAILSIARSAVQFVANAFRKFANWVKNDFFKTLHRIKEVLLKIWAFVQPILKFLLKLAIVVGNPLLLPVVITGYMWQILPDCFKPPIVDFILDLIIAAVSAIPTWKVLGEAWPKSKAKILSTLNEVRNGPVPKKIEASNRVARIMSLDDLEWLGNLLNGMLQVPDHIEGQFEEELIGMNLTEPLPFERTAEPKGEDAVMQAVAAGGVAPENAGLLTNPNLTAGQIGVTNVANYVPEKELIEQLQWEGGDKEFRGPADPARSIAGVQAVLQGDGMAPTEPGTEAPGGAPRKPRSEMTTDEQLEDMMNQPPPDVCSKENKAAQPEGGAAIPEEMKIGPLTRGQRARYLLHQIGQGIKSWFSCNAKWLVPAIIGVIVVLIGLEILTGGAITAALPEIMDIFATIMIGVAAVRAVAYFAEYLAKAITGDVAGAAKSLARGLAIIAIELIFALLFNIDKVINTLKKGLKASAEAAAKAAKNAVKGTIESVEKLGQIGLKGAKTAGKNIAGFGKAIVRNGKLLLEGVGEGFLKGVRKIEELFQKLWSKLRFKAFRIRLSGSWFRLEGEINPWILLAEGKVQWLEADAPGAAKAMVGSELKVGERLALVIGKDPVPSALVKLLEHPPAFAGPHFAEEVMDLFNDAVKAAKATGKNLNLREVLQQAAVDVIKRRSGGISESILEAFRRTGIPEGTLDKALHALMNDSRSVLSPDQLLGRLNQLTRMNPDGLGHVIADLATGGNKTVAAEWVIRFVTESPGARVSAIRAFEEASGAGARFYDLVMNGMHYEFKNAAEFAGYVRDSFMKQVLYDFKNFGDLSGNMRWVFSPRVGGKEALLEAMRSALRDPARRAAVGMTEAQAIAIEAELKNFVIVGLGH
jgi:hypothetical protein